MPVTEPAVTTGAQDRRWLFSQARSAGGSLALAVGLGLSAGLLLILQASLLARVVDGVVFAGESWLQVQPLVAGILLLVLSRALLVGGARWQAGLAAAKVKYEIRQRLLANQGRLSGGPTDRRSTGATVTAAVDGVEALDGYYAGYLPQLAMAALLPAAMLVFVFPLDWLSGLILLLSAPFIPLFMVLIGRKAEQLSREQWRQINRLSHRFLDAIQGLTTIRLFNAGRREAQMVTEISEQYREKTMAVLRVAFLSALVLEFMATVSVAVVAVLLGFRLLWNELPFASAFFILLLAPEFYLPLRNLGTHFHARQAATATAGLLQEEPPMAGEPVCQRAGPVPLPASATVSNTPFPLTMPPPSRADLPMIIHCRGVSFAYEPGQPVLHDFNLTVTGPGLICLAGKSGCGKSTLLKLLAGLLHPTAGQITANGTPLQAATTPWWWQQLAYLPQTPYLLPASVAANIALGRPGSGRTAVAEAARQVGFDREVQQLPAGYRTRLAEEGRQLSGGQRQLLALARAWLRNCPLVLLDEPGAGLDPAARRRIRQGIVALTSTRTVVISSHDPAMVTLAAQVVNLDAHQR
ncbi:thiol reductant ABC exporter subunit CydD [Desulfurivibrio alkaliphilus]|uniref:ABC transporter, CydDC cysteine exporter (CydDC-E) family, permease/ATP-binding protein CydD n=1 Tax=Desulfurivibrio alkaliphilus (strain DSM 19089 / UNIQEM U267 / AHT2) TaxID=589865 RepID=D6Z1S1_DESAT|nr:thiol reductant ABC exporter subunit CydD [Desulfurivibrio alkaliphilus]ADH85496.1 ABC transporter, CydDC cysteine exporter (CydDC-E) family, permease/ATP-binding protein CydD [Desulfurivibrio alkaliphilus AHT 2]